MSHHIQTSARPKRRRELDLMGMLIVLGLIPFHTANVFDPLLFYVQNKPPSMVALVFVAFAGLWTMPLMMLIAGIATWYSLRKRTASEFVRERFRRLFIPFVAGLIILVPPLVYYSARQHDPSYSGTYAQFLPQFFNVRFALEFPLFIKGAPPQEYFQFGHLWFLIMLLAFTITAAAALSVSAKASWAASG